MLGIRGRRRWLARAACGAVAVLAGVAPQAEASYGPGELLFTMADERITESSGVAAARLSPGILFTHNDSADTNRIFAIGPTGETVATITVAGAGNYDWEDLAAGPGPDGQPRLFIGEIGDNFRLSTQIFVYEIAEPVIDPAVIGQTLTVPVLKKRAFRYPDGPHDAEGLMVDPQGRISIVTKEPHGVTGVYAGSGGPALVDGVVPETLVRVGTMSLTTQVQPGGDLVNEVEGGLSATGADWSPDGSRVVVRTYWDAFEWTIVDGDLAASLEAPPTRVVLRRVRGGEAIAYTADGSALVTTTEGVNAPVHRFARQ